MYLSISNINWLFLIWVKTITHKCFKLNIAAYINKSLKISSDSDKEASEENNVKLNIAIKLMWKYKSLKPWIKKSNFCADISFREQFKWLILEWVLMSFLRKQFIWLLLKQKFIFFLREQFSWLLIWWLLFLSINYLTDKNNQIRSHDI